VRFKLLANCWDEEVEELLANLGMDVGVDAAG
jgi:hypothetical protein